MRIILASIIALVLAYFYTDRQLYFYGKSDLDVYHPLPINVKPDYWGYDLGNTGFVLIDDFDFVVAGKGVKYRNSEVVVNEIIKYGFDREKVFALVSDSLDKEHWVRLQSAGGSDIEASVDATVDQRELAWIEIEGKEVDVRMLEWIHSFVRIGLFILIVVIGIKTIRVLLQKVNRPTTTKT